jgi:hypothetical protein
MFGHWLETEFPKAVEFIQNKYQMESREVRGQLAQEYNLPGLRQQMGSAEFAAAFNELHNNVELLQENEDDIAIRYKIEALNSYYRRFNEIGDMQTQMQHDILPELQGIAKGQITELDPTRIVNMFRSYASISARLRNETPESLQPQNGQKLYDAFAQDMKELISYAQRTNGQKKSVQALAPAESHAEGVQHRNRIEDYWRQR